MYNPVNMKIEDNERLYEKDLREKNKRQRFEVKYDVEAKTRKDGMRDFDKSLQQKINKVSHMRFKEETERGFDILTNDPHSGPQASKTMYNPRVQQPRGVWTKAISTCNKNLMTGEQIQAITKEEEGKVKQTQADFHKT